MKTISFLMLAWVAAAQTPTPALTPGVITLSPKVAITLQQQTLTVVAGKLKCTFTTTNGGATLTPYCYDGTSPIVSGGSMYVLLAPTKPTGPFIGYGTADGDIITCKFWRVSIGAPVNWEIVGNGERKVGVF